MPIDTIELKSTLPVADHPKPDPVAQHAADLGLQHLRVLSKGGGKRLKDGRFQTNVFYREAGINRSTGDLLVYDWSSTKVVWILVHTTGVKRVI